MGEAKSGNKRLMITLPKKLVRKLEDDTSKRGLNLTKSARIQLALEKELQRSKKDYKDDKEGQTK